MADNSKDGFIAAGDIIRSYKASKGDQTLHGFLRMLHWLIKGYRELNLGIGVEPRTAMVKLDDLKRANVQQLPGFRTLTKVGLQIGDRIVAFHPDASINKLFKKNDDGSNIPNKNYIDTLDEERGTPWYEVTFYNYVDVSGNMKVIHAFGQGHNGVGYFTYDRQTGYLMFSADTKAEKVYIEYIKDIYEFGTKTMVPIVISEYLEDYIRWSESRWKNGDASAETIARSMQLKESLGNVIMRTDSLNPSAIMNIVQRSISRMH
jgi:hypothetical protein